MNKLEIWDFFDHRSGVRSQFDPYFLSRHEWAQCMGIGRTTIWRWEEKIIRLVIAILQEYQTGHDYLDNYQRFILAAIYALKNGYVESGRKMSNDEVKAYFREKRTLLTRKQFENWRIGNGVHTI
ncbi:hypothetical protein [Nostoc sp.]|uniref:hypothetical protein n=1 Tax=Nostoc sp. TaxID=1180 RepID=UPI002FFC5EBE